MSSHNPHNEPAQSVIDALTRRLMGRARERTIRRAVVGARFCGVTLDDGATGVASRCLDVHGGPPQAVSDHVPQIGSPAADALATLAFPTGSAVGLATANALANRPDQWEDGQGAPAVSGDLLDVLELRPDDDVGMVGCFMPLVDAITRRVRRLFIFERDPHLTPDLLPEGRAAELLPHCSVAIITAMTLLNGTIDTLLATASDCREVVILGPSTPLVPAVFAEPHRRASLLAGVMVTDSSELMRVVACDGSTPELLKSVAKVNVRVGGVIATPSGGQCWVQQGQRGLRL